MINAFKVRKGLNLDPQTGTAATVEGDVVYRDDVKKIEVHDGTTADNVVLEVKAATLTNKSIDSDNNTLTNIVNANIKAAAGIVYSKLTLTGGIVNADINASAAIAYSKLNLSASIVNADVAAAAAIARTKIASGTADHVIINDGSGVLSSEATLAKSRGGTGQTNASLTFPSTGTVQAITPNNHGVLLSGTGATATVIAPDASTVKALISGGASADPAWGVLAIGGGGTGQVTKAAGFDALSPMTTAGDLIYGGASGTGTRLAAGTANQVIKMVNGNPAWSAAPTGGVNYLATNPDAETDTSGWATYADSAANIPADGTGGSATNLTFSRSTSSPLRGTGSFSMAQANSTSLQGKGVSYDFTIDSADKAKTLSIQFDFNASSTFVASNGTTAPLNDGTTTTNAGNSDIEIFVYDVTNSTLIYVSPQVIVANGSNNSQFVGTFQTASNSTSYRLIFHVATTSANATGWTFKFDNVFVGPQQVSIPVSSVVAVANTTATLAVTSGSAIAWTNVVSDPYGGFSSGVYTVPVSGTYVCFMDSCITGGNSSNFFLNKNGVSVGRINANGNGVLICGQLSVKCNAGDTLSIVPGSSVTLDYTAPSGTTTGLVPSFTIVLSSGLGASVGSPSAVVAMMAYTLSSDTTVSGTASIITTKSFDTHNAYNTSTGQYTVPVSGYYQVAINSETTNSSVVRWRVAKNGTLVNGANNNAELGIAGTTSSANGSMVLPFIAGDIITVVPQAAVTMNTTAFTLSIFKLSGASTNTASSVVSCGVTGDAASATVNNPIIFPTISWDTHAGYNASTGAYTVPVAGFYKVHGFISGSASTLIKVFVNGSSRCQAGFTVATNFNGAYTATVKVLAGDTIDIRPSATQDADANSTMFIERVGTG